MSLLEMLTENRNIVKIKSPNEEPFILESGKKSRFFIDIKYASTKPLILKEIVGVSTSSITIQILPSQSPITCQLPHVKVVRHVVMETTKSCTRGQ